MELDADDRFVPGAVTPRFALGDLLAGLPIDGEEKFTGDFWDLLTPYGLWMGLTLLGLCLVHGATFMSLKARGHARDRSGAVAIEDRSTSPR